MPKPQYPTREGLWSKGQRKEEGFEKVRLGFPYKEAVENFRRASQDRADFDPAVLFAWGTMQATAVLNILKAVEEAFGAEGQATVRRAINSAGYEAMSQFLDDSDFPEDVDRTELISYVVTGINTVLYASLERPWIESDQRSEFDILWCPHQDRYTAFDCRVQRYFVEGMINALDDSGLGGFTPTLEKLIPRGAECCHFVVDRWEGDGKNPWHQYSEDLGQRAFRKMGRQDDEQSGS